MFGSRNSRSLCGRCVECEQFVSRDDTEMQDRVLLDLPSRTEAYPSRRTIREAKTYPSRPAIPNPDGESW
jgi:hypothetical protein